MLNLKRGKRVFSVILVAVMLFAAVFAAIGFSSAEKSNGEMLIGTSGVGNIKLSATESVETTVEYVGEDIFDSLTVKQKPIITKDSEGSGSILVTGKVNGEYGNVIDGNIGVQIGDDPSKSHITGLPVKSDGTFELEIVLNAMFCSEYGNKIPVIICYSKVENSETVLYDDIEFVLGVITYDYATGALRYPAGAEYVSETGVKPLSTLYVPADAKDVDGKVTVMYNGFQVSFERNPKAVAEAPSGNIGSVADVSDDSVTLNTVIGLEYGYVEVDESIGAGYGSSITWVKADSSTMVITLPKSGTTYTYWVRTPGADNGEILPSAPVLLAKMDTLTEDDSNAKNEFLEKYEEIVTVPGKKLYSSADPAVTASKTEISQLLALYNGLSDDVKALNVIDEKGRYLILSKYLTEHQDIIAAAKTADKFDELRANFTYTDMNLAYGDFADIAMELMETHFADEVDGAFIFELSLTVQKIYVLLDVDENDAAKDLKYEAVDYIYDTAVSKTNGYAYDNIISKFLDISKNPKEELYVGNAIIGFDWAKTEPELMLFIKKHDAVLSADEITDIKAVEAVLDDLIKTNINTTDGFDLATTLYVSLNNALYDLYEESLEKLLSKYDEDVAYMIIYNVDNVSVDEDYYPESKMFYDTVVRYAKLYDEYASAINGLEGLKNGRSEQVADILDGHIYVIEGIFENFNIAALYESETPDVYLANDIDAIKLEVTNANNYLSFIDKKAAAKAEIEALKDNNKAVIDAANKYHPEIDVIEFDYDNTDALNANIDAVLAAAKAEIGFEKKRAEAVNTLASDVAAKKTSGRYSASQIAQLDSYLAEAVVLVNNLDYAAEKTVADIEAQQAASLAKFATVNVITVSVGNVPYVGDLSEVDYPADYNLDNGLFANVTNMNGFSSALTLNVKMVASDEKLKVNKVSVATGEFTEEQAIAAVDNKDILLKLDITMGDVSADNGLYTVKVLLPADVRDEEGIYVVSQSGDTTYVYETTREGDFIVFKTASFSEFIVVGDNNANLVWLAVLLTVLLVAEIAAIVFFIVKKKGAKKN